MKIMLVILATIIAVLLAVLLERLLRQYLRKMKDDCSRIDAAQKALIEQQGLIDRVLNNEKIPLNVKTFVIEFSEVIPSQTIAHQLAAWMEEGMRGDDDKDESDEKADQLFDDLTFLRKSDPEAFELVNSALRGAFVAIMLQWPATARCLQRMYYDVAVETTAEVAKSAAAMHRAARHRHWVEPDAVAA